MNDIKVVDACVECGGTSFTDLPPGSATARWGAEHEHPHCVCDDCGAWYWQEAIGIVRTPAPPTPADISGFRDLFRNMREESKSYRLREIAALEAKTDRLKVKEAVANEKDEGGDK